MQHHRKQRKPQQAVLQALHAGVVQQLAVGADLLGGGEGRGRQLGWGLKPLMQLSTFAASTRLILVLDGKECSSVVCSKPGLQLQQTSASSSPAAAAAQRQHPSRTSQEQQAP